MKKKWFISKDSDYYKDNEEAIKLESCPDGGELCKMQMLFMNQHLLEAHKFLENKDYIRAVESIKISFNSTFDLKEQKCKACTDLFRETIFDSLNQVISDLKGITTGIFARKNLKPDLTAAQLLLQEMQEKMKL
jgi:hypothetical protein